MPDGFELEAHMSGTTDQRRARDHSAPTHTLSEVIQRWGALDRGTAGDETVVVEGRLVSAYQEGARLAFWMVNDEAAELQVLLTPTGLGDAQFDDAVRASGRRWQRVKARGTVMRTRRGLLTINATGVALNPD
jgi:lysyl-tRNA synthetase class II